MKRFTLPLTFVAFGLFGGISLARDVPYLSGRVVDEAHMLNGAARNQIEGKLAEIESQTSAQVALLTIQSLEGDGIEDFSMRAAQTWKLGQKGKDNGVLFLIAVAEHKMRIEVGYGLEGTIPDAYARRILDDVARPAFRHGGFNSGVNASIDAIAHLIEGENINMVAPRRRGLTHNDLDFFVPFGMILIWFVLMFTIFRRRGSGSHWVRSGGNNYWIGGGGFTGGGFSGGGGGFSGGGGSFGGGGASGSW